MSVSYTVFLDVRRFPSARELNAHARKRKLPIVIDESTELRSLAGHLPSTFAESSTSFEFLPQARHEMEFDDEILEELAESIGTRDLAVSFVGRDKLSVSAALVAACTLCDMADGVLFAEESGSVFAADEVIELAEDETLEFVDG
jgi:hypothetical protein